MNGASFDGGTFDYLASVDPEGAAGLIAVERPRESTSAEVHMPRLFVPDECIEKCGGLAVVAANVLYRNAQETDEQNDVVCYKKGRRLCNAFRHLSGTYSQGTGWGIEGTDELFLLNPSRYYEGKVKSAAEVIQKATALGITAHKMSELRKRNY